MDYERSIIPHYTNVETMQQMLDAGVNEELFANEELRKIFLFSRQYFLDAKMKFAVSPKVLNEEFEQYFKVNGYPSEDEYITLPHIISKLKQQYKRIQATTAIRSSSENLLEMPDEAIAALIQDLSRIQMNTTTADRLEIYGENFEDRVEAYVERAVPGTRDKLGVPMGWGEVTTETGGLKVGELAVVVGYAGVGKSWVLSKMALEAAKSGKRVYYATLENSKEMTMDRLDCLVSGVPYREYERGELTPSQKARLEEAKDEIKTFDNLLIDAPRHRNERTAIELYSRASFFGADVIIGDQLSHIYNPSPIKNNDPFLRMGDTIVQVSDLTRSFDMASIWAAQFNRDSQKGKGKKGELHQIALSAEVERYVDFAMSISATAEMRREEKTLLYIMKARRSRQDVGWIMDWALMGETRLEVFREWNQLEL